jgi:hypothetical protein
MERLRTKALNQDPGFMISSISVRALDGMELPEELVKESQERLEWITIHEVRAVDEESSLCIVIT